MRKLLAAAILLALAASAALAQSSGQTPGGATVPGQTVFCPTGIKNADGTFQVGPCGGQGGAPLQVIVVNPAANPAAVSQPLQTTQCPPNPLTGKNPPLC